MGFIQPAVHHLLDGPRGFAQIVQADHAATALQCMKATAHDRQRIVVIGRGMDLWQLRGDGRQHLVGFFEKNLQQLGIQRIVFAADGLRICRRRPKKIVGVSRSLFQPGDKKAEC